MQEEGPIDADDLMLFADRIEGLPPDDAVWVARLFQECVRARMHEAELMTSQGNDTDAATQAPELDVQLAQVALDTADWLKTLWEVGYMGAGSFPSQPRTAFPLIELEDVLKSSLFARIREGKRPLPFPPPTRNGLPWHELVEGTAEMFSVEAEIVSDDSGAPAGAIIDGCADWRVLEERVKSKEYIIQHRGKGPLFHLFSDPFGSRLKREAPRWQCEIHHQQRGGVRTYVLAWTLPDGKVRDVPLRALTWERAESEAAYWIATNYPEMYGQVSFTRVDES